MTIRNRPDPVVAKVVRDTLRDTPIGRLEGVLVARLSRLVNPPKSCEYMDVPPELRARVNARLAALGV